MGKTAFVAGKVSGLPHEEVTEKFARIANELSGMGYQVIKPVSVTKDVTDWQIDTKDNIKSMLECDEVHLLPCWQESKGAQLERDIALRVGMQVVYH